MADRKPAKLRKLRITRVDRVEAGAAPDAHVVLYKAAKPVEKANPTGRNQYTSGRGGGKRPPQMNNPKIAAWRRKTAGDRSVTMPVRVRGKAGRSDAAFRRVQARRAARGQAPMMRSTFNKVNPYRDSSGRYTTRPLANSRPIWPISPPESDPLISLVTINKARAAHGLPRRYR